MIDFSTLQGLTIPEGVVTQIADASGRVLWAVSGGKVILEVGKITSNTYAGETTYTDEQFILLDIYPKTNGTVKVTYGGLTKTITDTSGAASPNAQRVFFGTFNGVSDEVETPASGELTIEGECNRFSQSTFVNSSSAKASSLYCECITNVIQWGNMTSHIPESTFLQCTKLALTELPTGIRSIGDSAFSGCTKLALTELPTGIRSIGDSAFKRCGQNSFNLFPEGLTSIGYEAFYMGDVTSDDESSSAVLPLVRDVILPSTLTEIGGNCFCTKGGTSYTPTLETIKILATTPPSISTTTFGGSTNFNGTIIVPKGCGEVYKAAEGWSEYADYIVEES